MAESSRVRKAVSFLFAKVLLQFWVTFCAWSLAAKQAMIAELSKITVLTTEECVKQDLRSNRQTM